MQDLFIARQPIFDASHKIVAYELLYRPDGEAQSATGGVSTTDMSSRVIVDGVLGFGLDRLTEGQRAFINLPEHFLLNGVPEVLDPDRVVLEILETVRPTAEVLEACTRLRDQGYTLAMDDFVYSPEFAPLLKVCQIVKIDVLAVDEKLERMAEGLKHFDVQLLAEKVENAEVHDRCRKLGFEMFQGFYYFKPQTVTRKDLSAESVTVMRLLNLLGDNSVPDRIIEEAFRSDPKLTYKLLRIVNSAAYGGRGVDSITHALRLLGREPLYRWMSLLLLTVGGAKEGHIGFEMVKSALLRGRMAETVGDAMRRTAKHPLPSGGTLFLVGLFSHMDALMGVEMAEIMEELDVSSDVKDALLGGSGPAGAILRGVCAYEDGDWLRASLEIENEGGDSTQLAEQYMSAFKWANDRMSFHESGAAAA